MIDCRPVQPDKIIKQTHDSLQSRRDMMIISIIAILLLAGGIYSSLPVQGSVSMVYDNTMLIDLRASRSNIDDIDELIEKLQGMENPRVHLIVNLGRKVIEVNGETDLEQDYFKIGNDMEDILQHVALLIQDHDKYYKKLTHQNLISYNILRHVPRDYQDFMNLDKNYFAFSWMLSHPEFVLEIKRLISQNELSLEYAKSVQHVLVWLIKLFDIKWRQLHDDLDYISRWRLLNLQKQAEFILDDLVANQRRHEKSKNKHILEDRNDIISNIEKIEVEEATLIKQDKENLSETNKIKISKDKSLENIPIDYITSTEETRVMNHPELKPIKNDMKDKSPASVKIPLDQKFNVSTDNNSITNGTKIKTLDDRNLVKNETSSKLNKFINTRHDYHKRFNQLENVSSILPSENAIDTLQETDKLKPMETAMHGSLKNITNILKTRRTLDIFVPSNKNEEYDGNRQVSTRNIIDKHHYFNKRTEIKSDSASAMDEILEAVDEVLPTDKSVEMSSKESEIITRAF